MKIVLVLTIEPLIAINAPKTVTMKDGWTVRTKDTLFADHYEHTLVVTGEGATLLAA